MPARWDRHATHRVLVIPVLWFPGNDRLPGYTRVKSVRDPVGHKAFLLLPPRENRVSRKSPTIQPRQEPVRTTHHPGLWFPGNGKVPGYTRVKSLRD